MEYESPLNLIIDRATFKIVDKKNLTQNLKNTKLRVKFGIDPTGKNIHLGRASTIQRLRDFQELGHKIVLIIGDFTATVGDSSDKKEFRKNLSRETVNENFKTYKKQLSKILDLSKVEFRYNSEWLDKLEFSKLIALSKKFTVAQMIERENFHYRYNNKIPIGLHEFLYPLMQGYDSVAIKSDVELGGSDQLFNLLSGREVQEFFGMKKQDIVTKKLLIGTDGRKMSTSWGNVINIMDTPNDIYGKVMSIRDTEIIEYFTLTTRISDKVIKEINNDLKKSSKSGIMDIKKTLAFEITSMYSNKKDALKAEEYFKQRIQNKDYDKLDDIIEVKVKSDNVDILTLISNLTGQMPSRAEAKRLILSGAVLVDKKKVLDYKEIINIKNKMMVKVGKKSIVRIKKDE